MKKSELKKLIREEIENLLEASPIGYDGKFTLQAIKNFMDLHSRNLRDYEKYLKTAKNDKDRKLLMYWINQEKNNLKALESMYNDRTRPKR